MIFKQTLNRKDAQAVVSFKINVLKHNKNEWRLALFNNDANILSI